MTNLYQITADVPLPVKQKLGNGHLVQLIFSLQPGESFLCPHQASSSLRLVQRTNPDRKFRRHIEKPSGYTRIYRIE